MSDRTKIQRKKAAISTYTQPSLAQKSTQGFGLSSSSPSQSIVSPQSHDISRISLRPQAKLTVSQPGDIYEQEADNVAEQVMRMAIPETLEFSSAQTVENSLQRKCAACENEETEEIQRKPTLQRVAESNIQQPNNIESQLSATQGGGSPLPDNVRGFMEPRFGADFGSVRVHTNSAAVQLSRDLGAQAFTYGSDIYFGAGKSPGNNELTAHELTHVIQQTGGVQTKLLSNSIAVQRKYSTCAQEEIKLQRSPNVLSTSEIIQRREVCDDEGVCRSEPDKPAESITSTENQTTDPSQNQSTAPPPQNQSTNTSATEVDTESGDDSSNNNISMGIGLKPPGDCEKSRHRALQNEVKRWCKGEKERGCDDKTTPEELEERISNAENCIKARTLINKECFKEGDPGHQQALNIVINRLARCQKFKEKVPQPVPSPEEQTSPDFMQKMAEITGLTGAALIAYLIISEGSRLFPPRNLIPVP